MYKIEYRKNAIVIMVILVFLKGISLFSKGISVNHGHFVNSMYRLSTITENSVQYTNDNDWTQVPIFIKYITKRIVNFIK